MKEETVEKNLNFEYDEYSCNYSVRDIGNYEGETLVIPREYKGIYVTKIEPYSFQNNKSVLRVEMSDLMESIGEASFNRCENLREVVLSENLRVIPKYTFCGCGALSRITKGKRIKQIDDWAFAECTNLQEIPLFEGLLRIGVRAFYDCKKLQSVKLPSTLKVIEKDAFYGCLNLTEIDIDENVGIIGDWAFADCKNLQSIRFLGTEKQWLAVQKGKNWDLGIQAEEIQCKDATVKLEKTVAKFDTFML